MPAIKKFSFVEVNPELSSFTQLFQQTARSWEASLARTFRTSLKIQYNASSECNWDDFRHTKVEQQVIFLKLQAPASRTDVVISIPLKLLSAFVDHCIGGSTKLTQNIALPLSTMNRRLADRLGRQLIASMQDIWSPHLSGPLNCVDIVEPHLYNGLTLQSQKVTVLSFAMELQQEALSIALVIPATTARYIRNQKQVNGQIKSTEWAKKLTSEIGDSKVQVVAKLGSADISIGDILKFKVGDIIMLDRREGDPIDVEVEGIEKFKAVAGQKKKRRAIKIVG